MENEFFVEFVEKVKEMIGYVKDYDVIIVVMGCWVNGFGEMDDVDFGFWCGFNYVNLKCKSELIGVFKYDEIFGWFKLEFD